MDEIVDGVFHWSCHHDGIDRTVHSTFVAATDPPVLIDPMPPDVDLDWFDGREPRHVYLTNRHHYRAGDAFVEAFDCDVRCHEAGLHEFAGGPDVRPFRIGDVLPGGIEVLQVGSLCPEECALRIPVGRGILALGDAVVRFDEDLGFVPDALMGDDPESVKAGIRRALARLLDWELEFDTLVMAHGQPWVGEGRRALREWLEKSVN